MKQIAAAFAASLPAHATPFHLHIFSTAAFAASSRPFSEPIQPTTHRNKGLRFQRPKSIFRATFHEHQMQEDEIDSAEATVAGMAESSNYRPDDTDMDDKLLADLNSTTELNLHERRFSPENSTSPIINGSRKDAPKDSNILGMPPTAILALNAVAIIWGTQHAVIKLIVDDSGAGPFTFLRFGIGAIIATVPLLFRKGLESIASEQQEFSSSVEITTSASILEANDNLKLVSRWGAEMGLWLFLGFAFQAIGLSTTTAQRSGFLLYLNVKLVPFFAFILFRREISIPTWISALTAFAGTALLAYDGTTWNINQGDLWSMAAAAASAMYILRIGDASNAVGAENSLLLNASCLWVVAILSGIWSISTVSNTSVLEQLISIATSHPLELFYLSAVTTALANYIQTKSQKDISPERASVIYSMDPVYGGICSYLLLGETLTSLGLVGAGMITVAAATNAFLDLNKGQEEADFGADNITKKKSQ